MNNIQLLISCLVGVLTCSTTSAILGEFCSIRVSIQSDRTVNEAHPLQTEEAEINAHSAMDSGHIQPTAVSYIIVTTGFPKLSAAHQAFGSILP